MNTVEKIINWFKVYSRKNEEATERDGFLSYAGEFHSLFVGAGIGAIAAIRQQPELAAAFIAVALGMGTVSEVQVQLRKALKGSGKAGELASALGEVRREPWYGLGGELFTFILFWLAMHGPDSLQQALIDSLEVLTSMIGAV